MRAVNVITGVPLTPSLRPDVRVRNGVENVALHSLQSLDDPLAPLLEPVSCDAAVCTDPSVVSTMSTTGHDEQPMLAATTSTQEEENPYTQQDALRCACTGHTICTLHACFLCRCIVPAAGSAAMHTIRHPMMPLRTATQQACLVLECNCACFLCTALMLVVS